MGCIVAGTQTEAIILTSHWKLLIIKFARHSGAVQALGAAALINSLNLGKSVAAEAYRRRNLPQASIKPEKEASQCNKCLYGTSMLVKRFLVV